LEIRRHKLIQNYLQPKSGVQAENHFVLMDYILKTEFLFFVKKAPSLPGRDGYRSSISVTLFRGFYFPNLVGTLEHGLVGGDVLKIQALQPAQT
jgi:hypothetical protein